MRAAAEGEVTPAVVGLPIDRADPNRSRRDNEYYIFTGRVGASLRASVNNHRPGRGATEACRRGVNRSTDCQEEQDIAYGNGISRSATPGRSSKRPNRVPGSGRHLPSVAIYARPPKARYNKFGPRAH